MAANPSSHPASSSYPSAAAASTARALRTPGGSDTCLRQGCYQGDIVRSIRLVWAAQGPAVDKYGEGRH